MYIKRKQLHIFLQILLSATATAFFVPCTFSPFPQGLLPNGIELLLRVIGVICASAAILLLMVYTVHKAKGAAVALPFSAACKHAGHVVLLLLCMLPALLLFSILEGLYFWLISPYFFNTASGIPSPLGLFLATIPALAILFLLPLALHPFFSTLIYPRPIRETFRHALQTWKTMYKPLLFWCIAITAIQAAVSLISSAMPHGFSEFIPIISSAILQTAFFYKMLARYAREATEMKICSSSSKI